MRIRVESWIVVTYMQLLCWWYGVNPVETIYRDQDKLDQLREGKK